MTEDKKVKYEFDAHLPSLKMKTTDSKSKGFFDSSEFGFNNEFSPVPDKQNVVTRIIDHLKERL